jgi:hypothetical protein
MNNIEITDYTAEDFVCLHGGSENANGSPSGDQVSDSINKLALQQPKIIKKDELVRLSESAELFCEPDGNGDRAYATVPVHGHFETYHINSTEFRLWLTNEF